MGDNHTEPEEAPARTVKVDAFAMEQAPVTNRQFGAFVEDTGYVTVAERPLDPAQFPGLTQDQLQPGSMVFAMTSGPVDLGDLSQWWRWVPGASWRAPEGPGSDCEERAEHPVVHVAYEDAEEYATWAGRSLPTEAEWERAARGGIDGRKFVWGKRSTHKGRRLAKYWEGDFPWRNAPSDGFRATAPVGTYRPNDYGLLDIVGNVWEWTTDWFVAGRPVTSACCAGDDQRRLASIDPSLPQAPIPRKVVKGGSFLCADEYCQRYRPAARRPQMIDTAMSHIGFRCVSRTPT